MMTGAGAPNAIETLVDPLAQRTIGPIQVSAEKVTLIHGKVGSIYEDVVI